MRIFLVLNPSANLSVPGSMTWYRNLYEPLVDLGHDVFFFDLRAFCEKEKVRFRSPGFKKQLSMILPVVFRQENKKKSFDIFFSYLTDLDIEEGALSDITNDKLVKLNFSCNNTHQFYLVQNISRLFDYNLHSEKDASELFKNAGANPHWFQMAANPNYYKPYNTERIYDASFIGMNYSKRAMYIKHLLNNNIDVHCFGPNWKRTTATKLARKELKRIILSLKVLSSFNYSKRLKYSSWISEYDYSNHLTNKYPDSFHSPVNDQEMITLFSKSKVNLGFLEVYGSDNRSENPVKMHLHLREFEVPMCRGLYCTNYSDELSEHFIPDKEVIVFRNEHELADKIRYYLDHPGEAEIIREAGYRRAINDHTYHKRLSNLFNDLGFGK